MAKLFAKFGEFDSAEEINRAATAQLKEGDLEAVRMIAKENGIDDMSAEDFIRGDWPELCSPFMAAIGKLEVETAELDLHHYNYGWTLSGIWQRMTQIS